MITRELIKNQIDLVQDKDLDQLLLFVNALAKAPTIKHRIVPPAIPNKEWQILIDTTAGIFASDPIERGSQGNYEQRETLE